MKEKKEGPEKAAGKKLTDDTFIFEGFNESQRRQLTLLFIYLLLMLVFGLSLSVGFYFFDYFNENQKLVVYAARSGCLGGTIYCMWSYSRHIANKDFKSQFIVWYLFRPFVSAVLGIFSYYLIYSGVMATTLTKPNNFDPEFGTIFFCSIAFVAGFSVDEFVGKLGDVAKALFTSQGKKVGEVDNNEGSNNTQ